MRHLFSTLSLLCAGLSLAACSSAQRGPSSVEQDAQSVELASKLSGHDIKLRAYRDGDQVSVLGFVDLKFKDCQATMNTNTNSPSYNTDFEGSYVDCVVDLGTDPVLNKVHAKIKGDKHKFHVDISTEESNHYHLDLAVDMVWENKRWNGQGTATGWVAQKLGNGTSLTATVKESLSF